MKILHLSDLHFGTLENAKNWYDQLAEDLINELKCRALDALILSGDIANYSVPEEYEAAKQFLNDLSGEFKIEPSRIVMVPGNHDLNWKIAKKEGYDLYDREDYEDELREGCFIEEGKEIIRVRDEEKYKRRFVHFSEFYQAIKGEPYPQDYEKQGIIHHFSDHNILILGLNSAWQLDYHFTSRAGIHSQAVSRVLTEIRRKAEIYENCLKFAVWHHPLNSAFEDRITEHDFMQRLAQSGFCLAFHGHIHKADAALYQYDHSAEGRKIHVVCAGTFGAPVREWVPGYPLQYNFLNLEANKLTVKTRCRRELNGAWKPDAIWTQGAGKDPLPRYEILLPDVPKKLAGPAKIRTEPLPEENLLPPEIPELYKKWLTARCQNMDIDWLRGQKSRVIQVQLPEIFIPLYANPPVKKSERRDDGDEEMLREREKAEDIEKLIEEHEYLLIEGDPGSGKTTLVKHFSYSLIQDTDRLPVLIFLKDLKSFECAGLPASAATAEKILSHYFSDDVTANGLDAGTVRRFCNAGKAVLIFDGLDEIPRELRDLTAASFADFRAANGNCKTVFSGRPHGVDGTAVNRFGDRHVKILSLNTEQVEGFIRNWFCFIREADCEPEKTADDMIGGIRTHQNISELTDNPLMLTAVCMLYYDGGELPEQRAELYKKFVRRLLSQRFPKDFEKVHEFLMRLAFRMQQKGVRGADKTTAVEVLREVFEKEADEKDAAYRKRTDVLFTERVEPDCGLLVLDAGQYNFRHLTFQEFLTATYLIDKETQYDEAIKGYWDDERYEEVIQLFAGSLSTDNKRWANKILEQVLNQADSPPFRRWRLAARALLDIHKNRREIETVDLAAEKLRSVMDSDAAPKDRADAGEILGWLDDRRDLEIFIPIKGGTYELSRGTFEIKAFEIAKYPVTNRWFKRFVEDKGYENPEYWTEEGKKWLAHTGAKAPRYWHERKWNCPNAPVVGVCWYEAYAFCRWLTLTKDDGHEYRLPDENEWEAAAAGSEKREYPWGRWDEDRCNWRESGIEKTSAVGIFNKKGETPERVAELAGNAWECTRSDYHSEKILEDFRFETDILKLIDEYEKSSGKDKKVREQLVSKLEEKDRQLPVLRGGSWLLNRGNVRCANRNRNFPNYRNNNFGFRCVRTVIL